jgi:hypothetical protein
MTQVNHICDTPNACLCSGNDDECDCLHFTGTPNEVSRCVVCGARIIAIDFETGEKLAS